jgi:hypothetical protein
MTRVKNPRRTAFRRAKYNKEPQEVQMVFRPGRGEASRWVPRKARGGAGMDSRFRGNDGGSWARRPQGEGTSPLLDAAAAEGGLDPLPEGLDGRGVFLLHRLAAVAGLDKGVGQALQVWFEFRELLVQAVLVLVRGLA